MRKYIVFFSFFISTAFLSAGGVECLKEHIFLSDKRYPTFERTFKLLEKRNAKILLEMGTARNGKYDCHGDGCSTIIFSKWAMQNNAYLFSVDINQYAINAAQEACFENLNAVQFVCSDSIAFLTTFFTQIDFLYLDSFDFDINNPLPSQMHHLKEIKAAYPKLHNKSIVLIDDCDLPHGGKGKLVIEYLLKKGWIILEKGYQVLMVKENS